MTTLVAEKTKEIGVRKVLGAELLQIGALLLKTTIKQLFIAMAIGIPLAYFLIQKYLEKFLDHIILKWWHYGLPIAVLVSILLSTIAYMLWKAARSNPVEALKYE